VRRIDALIAELCPDGVDVKTLGEVGQFVRGNGLQKKDFVDDGVGCIHYGQIYTTYGTSAAVTRSFVSPARADQLRKAHPGDLVIATTSENDEDVGKAVAWIGESPIAISGDSYVYSHRLDPLYVAFFFQTQAFRRQTKRYLTGTKVKRVAGEHLARITIPVPPAEIQREIVVILTKLESLVASLDADLEAELDARRRQYEHYRREILSHGADRTTSTGWPKLGTLVSFTNGKPHEQFVVDGGNVALITSRFVSTGGHSARFTDEEHTLSPADAGDVAMVMSDLPNGRALARCYYVECSGKYTANQRVCLLRVLDADSTDSRYLFHFLNRNPQLLRYDNGQYQTHLKKADILEVAVPPLPLADQRRIAGVLDNFDASVNGLCGGLAAELRARCQQYQYYRERLLTFDHVAA
jgi:type I restriction enzyme S subunit